MSRFHEIKVAHVETLTNDAKAIYFDIPDSLKDHYKYTPGQYLTFEVSINGTKQRRAYSICTSPFTDAQPAIGVKKVQGGLVSNFMNDQVKAGDTLQVMEPMGNFIHVPNAANKHHYVLLGGGSGITPLMAILKSVLHVESESKITLFYANRDEQSIMFKAALESLQQQYGSRLNIIHNLDEGNYANATSGKLDAHKIAGVLKNNLSSEVNTVDYYICGPSGLMFLIDEALVSLNVAKNKIHKEYFTAPIVTEEHKAEQAASGKPLEEATLILQLDGEHLEVAYNGQKSILEAVLDAGYDPPFACQIGACCTCRAKVSEGKVVMADRESLSDAEIKEGYILTCQAKPLTSKLVYSYDE
jgi:ring-1,2-phenylacetyl-CoA epoxidase subunit PaaE